MLNPKQQKYFETKNKDSVIAIESTEWKTIHCLWHADDDQHFIKYYNCQMWVIETLSNTENPCDLFTTS